MRLLATFFVLVPLLIDYFSKKYIENNFDTHAIVLNDFIIIDKTYNKGIAFSLFNFDSPLTNIFFSIIVIFIIAIIINFVLKNLSTFNKSEFFAWHIVIGAAIANLIDRITNGSVLDFIIVHYENIYFPAIFNFADAFISLGVFLLIINYFIYKND